MSLASTLVLLQANRIATPDHTSDQREESLRGLEVDDRAEVTRSDELNIDLNKLSLLMLMKEVGIRLPQQSPIPRLNPVGRVTRILDLASEPKPSI